MDIDINLTHVITIGGYVALDRYGYVYFVALSTVYIMIICSNFTIISIIVMQKSLHEPMYIFIAALLVNSVVFSTAIYPKLLIDFLSPSQIITYSACLFQFFMFYSLCGSEVLLLLAMACDRYVSICKPLHYQTIMGHNTVSISLVFAWLVPAAYVAVATILNIFNKLCDSTLLGIFCNSTVKHLYCVSSTVISLYAVVVLFLTFILPVLFIFFTYAKIFVVAYRSSEDTWKRAAHTCLPHLLVLISFSCFCSFDVIIVGLGFDFPKTVHIVMTLQMIIYQPLFNPIIYGLKMKEITKHLERLFCGEKMVGNRDMDGGPRHT